MLRENGQNARHARHGFGKVGNLIGIFVLIVGDDPPETVDTLESLHPATLPVLRAFRVEVP